MCVHVWTTMCSEFYTVAPEREILATEVIDKQKQ